MYLNFTFHFKYCEFIAQQKFNYFINLNGYIIILGIITKFILQLELFLSHVSFKVHSIILLSFLKIEISVAYLVLPKKEKVSNSICLSFIFKFIGEENITKNKTQLFF